MPSQSIYLELLIDHIPRTLKMPLFPRLKLQARVYWVSAVSETS